MRVQRPDGMGTPLYVMPESGRTPLAGPFETGFAARLWVLQHVEAGLSPAKAEVWRQVSGRLPSPTDLGLELALISLVGRGKSLAQVVKYLPAEFLVDRKRLSAGERAA